MLNNKGNTKIWFSLIIIAIVIIVLLVVFWPSNNSGLFSAGQETIKIGVAVPLTGEVASLGQNALAGIKLATDEINSKGGIDGKQIQIIAEDSKCNSSDGVKAYNKLANMDNVNALLGFICSVEAKPALPIAENAKIPNIVITATAANMLSGNSYAYRVAPSDAMQGKFTAEYIYNKLNKKKIAAIYVNNTWGQSIYSEFQKRYLELGGELVYENKINDSELNFNAMLSEIKNSNAELIYTPIYPTNILALFKQTEELGLFLPIISGDGTSGEEVYSSGLGENTFFVEPNINFSDDFANKIKTIMQNNNFDVIYPSAEGYDAASILFNAMKKVGLDKDKIKDELQNTKYNGVSNYIEFNSDRELKSASYVVKQIQNKQAITIYKE